jgi:hypothetical protein
MAGILIPKNPKILAFFPSLDKSVKNPRISLYFYEEDGLTKWRFEFIYYNGLLFGGTRNEYRLTWMTEYLSSKNAKAGDQVCFLLDAEGRRHIRLIRMMPPTEDEDGFIKLRGGWKVIAIK